MAAAGMIPGARLVRKGNQNPKAETPAEAPKAGEWQSLFDAEQAQDALDQGYTLRTKDDPTPLAVASIAFDAVPDLAGWLDTFWVVNRDLFKPVGERNQLQMSFFGNNLIRPSAQAGLHAQLVSYDTSKDEAILVGQNNQEAAFARPGGSKTYQWYAGDLSVKRDGNDNQGNQRFRLIPTPIEFGASNLLSSDRVKQPQKGLFGALSILPAGSTVAEDTQVPDGQGTGSATRLTRAQVTVTAPEGPAGSGGVFRENLAMGHKIANIRWKDGTAIANVNQGELGREGAEDSGFAGFNYGMEPSWFRFQLPPDAPFGAAGAVRAGQAYPSELPADAAARDDGRRRGRTACRRGWTISSPSRSIPRSSAN